LQLFFRPFFLVKSELQHGRKSGNSQFGVVGLLLFFVGSKFFFSTHSTENDPFFVGLGNNSLVIIKKES